jgi:hypothetical protein
VLGFLFMYVYLSSFKKGWDQHKKALQLLEDAYIRSDRDYAEDAEGFYKINFSFANCTFSDIDKLYQYTKEVDDVVISVGDNKKHITQLSFGDTDFRNFLSSVISATTLDKVNNNSDRRSDNDDFYSAEVIAHEPFEFLYGEHTYRVLTSKKGLDRAIKLVSRDDDEIYNYLDKNHYVSFINKGNVRKVVVAGQNDQYTARIFALCKINPTFTELLQNGCFINPAEAQLTCLKMEKKLQDEQKISYNVIKSEVEQAYINSVKSETVRKFILGEIEKIEVNDITFTKTSATYQNVTIEANNLLDVIKGKIAADSEFDIYSIINEYANYVGGEMDRIFYPASETKSVTTFKVNDMSIDAHIKKDNHLRYINNICIYKDEIAEVLSRASCYRDVKQFNLFLKSVSRRSLEHHNIIANGFKVKICPLTTAEYRKKTPPDHAPVIKFAVDSQDDKIKLEVSAGRLVKINFRKFIAKATSINNRTNDKFLSSANYFGGEYFNVKDYRWAAASIIEALLECKDPSESLTADDLKLLLQDAVDNKSSVIKKSEEFMAAAVKATGAEKIRFKDQDAYKVKGSLREYVVIISTAKVYDYDTKQYRCVVNDNHYVGAGYDDVAARLLMLKNDSVMQNQVHTLRGAAQPQYEPHYIDNSHDREESVGVVAELIDKLVPA